MTTVAEVRLWGRRIGAVAVRDGTGAAEFEYDPAFVRSGVQPAPLMMPLSTRVFSFPGLARQTFHGLPGLLADSLPDRFGNALIDAWLATQGRGPESFNAVERLCYTGRRGMGALEYVPALGPRTRKSHQIDIDQLVELASEILMQRNSLKVSFGEDLKKNALRDILQVGTSAGGARAKAVIAWNRSTNEVRSGQVDAGPGFECWLLKFDGVAGNNDNDLNGPRGYGVVEYAYSRMARDAGITMSECRLFDEHERRHFMTRRFDRLKNGEKLHMQSLCALAHYDFNLAGGYSYEQTLQIIRQLGLPMASVEQQFRRMVFNILSRNQDDHVKNIAFLMDKAGVWTLAPAFDVTFSYQPEGDWTSKHQLTMNGKRDDFALKDFDACARTVLMKRGRAKAIVDEVRSVLSRWPEYADDAGVNAVRSDHIMDSLRLDLR